jgi:hypothetical protein
MRTKLKLLAGVAVSCAVVLAGAQAQAVTLVPFATYTQVGAKITMKWQHTGALNGKIFSTPNGHTTQGSSMVTFNFLDTSKYLDGLNAKLTLSGQENGNAATGAVDQSGIHGSFTFTYEGPTTTFMGKTYTHDVTNLLTGVYSLAHITGAGSSGSFHDSTDVGTVSYTSDIIGSLPSALARDFSFSLVSVSPPLGYVAGHSLNSFDAGATGIFSAGFVPEPATWAMMITGVGLLGLAARRRRSFSPA